VPSSIAVGETPTAAPPVSVNTIAGTAVPYSPG
jgi:hypothetical protein